VPVAEKHAGFATFFFGFGSGPFYKVQAVLIVLSAVAFQAKVNVCEDRGLLE
jgi:hypothetical protein